MIKTHVNDFALLPSMKPVRRRYTDITRIQEPQTPSQTSIQESQTPRLPTEVRRSQTSIQETPRHPTEVRRSDRLRERRQWAPRVTRPTDLNTDTFPILTHNWRCRMFCETSCTLLIFCILYMYFYLHSVLLFLSITCQYEPWSITFSPLPPAEIYFPKARKLTKEINF